MCLKVLSCSSLPCPNLPVSFSPRGESKAFLQTAEWAGKPNHLWCRDSVPTSIGFCKLLLFFHRSSPLSLHGQTTCYTTNTTDNTHQHTSSLNSHVRSKYTHNQHHIHTSAHSRPHDIQASSPSGLRPSVLLWGPQPFTSLTCAHFTATTIICKFPDHFLRGTSAPEQVDAVKDIQMPLGSLGVPVGLGGRASLAALGAVRLLGQWGRVGGWA